MDGGPSHGTLLLLLGRRRRRPRPSKRASTLHAMPPIKKWKRGIIGETRGWLRGRAMGNGQGTLLRQSILIFAQLALCLELEMVLHLLSLVAMR